MTDFKLALELANRMLRDVGDINDIDIELDEEGAGFIEVEKKYPLTLQLTHSCNFLKLIAYVGEHRSDCNPKTLEYLLGCNYEADFLKACTIGMCTLTRRFTLSFMYSIRNTDALQLNNVILNMGLVLKDLDAQLEQKQKPVSAGLAKFATRQP